MIKTRIGDILTLQRGILVHGCNARGVMGAGIARLIRDQWPTVYATYRRRYGQAQLQLGDIIPVGGHDPAAPAVLRRHGDLVCTIDTGMPAGLIVVNAITQYDFVGSGGGNGDEDEVRVHVDYDAVEAAFLRVKLLARDSGLPVHFPLIGCGLAGGSWAKVSARIESALGPDADATLWLLPGMRAPGETGTAVPAGASQGLLL